MSGEIIKLYETFNNTKLNYIINNFHTFGLYKDKKEEEKQLKTLKKYLRRSRRGIIPVFYKQKGKGRYFAKGGLSLQNIKRTIRHTIAKEYYNDIDIVNAHPVILEFLCKSNNIDCEYLQQYNRNREKILKDLNVDRKTAKKIFLGLTNDSNENHYVNLDSKTDFVKNYREEMLNIQNEFCNKFEKDFENHKQKRINNNENDNHNGSFLNILLCEMENKILLEMYKFFGSNENCVLCFDGLLLPKTTNLNLQKCENHIRNQLKINIKLTVKEMGEILPIPDTLPKFKDELQYDYFTDFKKIMNEENIYLEHVNEWCENTLILIENGGKPFYITKNLKHIKNKKYDEKFDEWQQVKFDDIDRSLKRCCNVINDYYNKDLHKLYKSLNDRQQKIKKEQYGIKIKPYIYQTLGNTYTRLGNGYLSDVYENGLIKSYDKIDFYPYLKSKGEPHLTNAFNIFTGFPLENTNINYGLLKFENSKFYKHLKEEFFNNDMNFFNHFLDHCADMIQDPANIKGTSYLFYSPQGCGKGMLYDFMKKMLGSSNCVSIINTDAYFKNFNKDTSNKILKCFEEVSEKGSAFSNHNRLKGEMTSDIERIENKGVDAITVRHCARYWFFTNNENALYIENDDRRNTLVKINGRHAQDDEYFAPIWNEINNMQFLKCAFNFFSNRIYNESNVRKAFVSDYKREQKLNNLGSGIQFIIDYIQDNFNKVENKDNFILKEDISSSFSNYCCENGTKYKLSTLKTQLNKIDIKYQRKRINNERGLYYIINTHIIEQRIKKYIKDDKWQFIF